MTSCHLPLYLVAIFSIVAMSHAAGQWNPNNCPGNITDIICCRDRHCADMNQAQCDQDNTCLWTQTKDKYECRPNRDDYQKVCCQTEVNEFCNDLIEGRCPAHFQVDKNCCSENGKRFTDVLMLDDPNKVCCNTPCTDARNSQGKCPLSQYCQDNPTARSLGSGYHNRMDPGFNPYYLPKLPSYGQVSPYTGFEQSHYQLPGKEHAVVGEVEEITVDDLMHAMVEALSNDKDVFSYAAEIHSDPYLGKGKYGGHLGGVNLPDPNIFLKQIYGNPYGMSRGQFGFKGQGWPQVQGVHPGSGHGYLQNQHGYGYGYGQGYNPYSSYGQSYNYNPYSSHGYGNPYNSGGYGYGNQYQSGSYGYGNQYNSGGYGYNAPSGYGSGYNTHQNYPQTPSHVGYDTSKGNSYSS